LDSFKYNVKKKGVGEKLSSALSSNENNSVLKLIRKMKLLFSYGENNLSQRAVAVQELVAFLESIMKSPATSDIFFYFLEHGAATAWLLQVDLTQPEASVYRALKNLRKMDILVDALKISRQRGSRGGPRPTVWALQGADAADVAAAIRKHYRSLSPKYRVAEELVQTVIQEHLERNTHVDGITHRTILGIIRGQAEPYHTRDIADLAATILREQGIKVWR